MFRRNYRKVYLPYVLHSFCFLTLLLSSAAFADEDESDQETMIREDNEQTKYEVHSSFKLLRNPEKTRNYLLSPFLSFLLPGLDQWMEGQYFYGGIYSGIAVGGLVYTSHNSTLYQKDKKKDDTQEESFVDTRDNLLRKSTLGMLAYQGAGGMSLYHSFRTAVPTQQKVGKFHFLTKEETVADLMLAPFQFSFLKRWTTFIPIGIAGLAYASIVNQKSSDSQIVTKNILQGSDYFFASAYSYNAGTHEEAIFRGWLMPVFQEWSGSKIVSNVGSAGIFALAHLSTNSVPIPQLLLGMHLGYVAQRNSWTLGESIFIHTWWDVIVFLAGYQVTIKQTKKNVVQLKDQAWRTKAGSLAPALTLPPISFVF